MNQRFLLKVTTEISQAGNFSIVYGANLRLESNVTFERDGSFAACAAVLQLFHDLAATVQRTSAESDERKNDTEHQLTLAKADIQSLLALLDQESEELRKLGWTADPNGSFVHFLADLKERYKE
jgi:hypothetical protein